MEKYIVQRASTPGWWVATDNENGVVVQFEHGHYDNTREVTLLNGDALSSEKEAMKVTTYLRELGDWLRDSHYEKLYSFTMRQEVGIQIRRERKRQGLSGKELAEHAGLAESTINKIENGRWNVGIDILEKICDALGVTVQII